MAKGQTTDVRSAVCFMKWLLTAFSEVRAWTIWVAQGGEYNCGSRATYSTLVPVWHLDYFDTFLPLRVNGIQFGYNMCQTRLLVQESLVFFQS